MSTCHMATQRKSLTSETCNPQNGLEWMPGSLLETLITMTCNQEASVKQKQSERLSAFPSVWYCFQPVDHCLTNGLVMHNVCLLLDCNVVICLLKDVAAAADQTVRYPTQYLCSPYSAPGQPCNILQRSSNKGSHQAHSNSPQDHSCRRYKTARTFLSAFCLSAFILAVADSASFSARHSSLRWSLRPLRLASSPDCSASAAAAASCCARISASLSPIS